MKTAKFHPFIETLEARIAPATITVTAGGAVTYSSGAGVANSLELTISGGSYFFTDTAETITVTGAGAGNFSGSGGNSTSATTGFITSIAIDMGDMDDTLTLRALADPLTVTDAAGADSITVPSGISFGTIAANGTLSLAAESITLASGLTGHGVTFAADDFDFSSGAGLVFLSAAFDITVKTLTPGRQVSLGSEVAGKLSLTDAELDRFSPGSLLRIGSATTGAIDINGVIDTVNGYPLSIESGASIAENGSGALKFNKLAVRSASGAVSLNGNNVVNVLAASLTGSGQAFSFNESAVFSSAIFTDLIGTVDGLTGLSVGTDAASSLKLSLPNTIALTQASGANVTTGGLELSGTSGVTLMNSGNDITTLAANLSVPLSYTDASAFSVGVVGGSTGISTSSHDLTLIAGGNLTINNPIDIDGANISLSAGAATLSVNAAVSATGSISLTADHMTFTADIDAATNSVRLLPFSGATTVRLGGADDATSLGLDNTELNHLTAGLVQIGASGATNPIIVSAALGFGNFSSLRLNGGSVTGTGAITIATLDVRTTGALSLAGPNDVDTLLFTSSGATGNNTFGDSDGFTLGDGSSNFDLPGICVTNVDVATATLKLGTNVAFDISTFVAGTGYDQLNVTGTINLNDVSLVLNQGVGVPKGAEFVIISNDGADDVTGTFDSLAEGDTIPNFSPEAYITYHGGDGNDVSIITVDPLVPTPSPNGKILTFRDVDGDNVTVFASKGTFIGGEITGVATGGPNGASQFQKLKLDATFTGANITITAKPSADGGNGFVNLGFLDATGVDLGAVTIAGDVARISAGSIDGDPRVPAIKSLTVQSIGLLGDSTLAGADRGFVGVQTHGAVPKLSVKDDLRGNVELSDADGNLGVATIGGSIVGSGIAAAGSIGLVKVAGDIRGTAGALEITASTGAIGALTVDGSIYGVSAAVPVVISAFGQPVAPARGTDLAIKTITVKGSVEFASFVVGHLGAGNADASIGSISVSGDWIASNVIAGVADGADHHFGTADDERLNGAGRDNVDISSSIGSFTVKGQAFGTDAAAGDMFGVVAEQIGKAKIGKRTFAFTKIGADAFFGASTGPGASAENPTFDFTIREVGALLDHVTFIVDLGISPDGKTAVFTDEDGDTVTVKRTAGSFAPGDFTFTPALSGGGHLSLLTISPGPNNAPVGITVTAKPSDGYGNSFVNIGGISAPNAVLGVVSIAGDIGSFSGGMSVHGKPGTASLTVQSLNVLGSAAAPTNFFDGIGKFTVATDVRADAGASNFGARIGSVTIGGSLVGAEIFGAAGLGAVKIAGSIRGGSLATGTAAIDAISVGGDILGGTDPVIHAYGQATLPSRGPDLAVKNLTVKGSVENANIELGIGADANADASIGAITVGRAWLGSNVFAGAAVGGDGFLGTDDDTKAAGLISTRDQAGLFSTIASLTIKGQALGTAAAGDHFGIVAEQVTAVKIGTAKISLPGGVRNAGDLAPLAPTGPGAGALPSDFYVREITV